MICPVHELYEQVDITFCVSARLTSLIARNFDVIMSTSEVGLDNRFAGSVDADRPSSSPGLFVPFTSQEVAKVCLRNMAPACLLTVTFQALDRIGRHWAQDCRSPQDKNQPALRLYS
jgi:hypothetical protein